MTHGFGMDQPDAAPSLLPRQRQEMAANLCWACRGLRKGLAEGPASLSWVASGRGKLPTLALGHSVPAPGCRRFFLMDYNLP